MLKSLMEKYGSDKGGENQRHNYTDIYDLIFLPYKDMHVNIFEVGIYKGASLRVWRDYFEKGHIYGGDIDRNTFIHDDKITSVWCDQNSKESLQAMWKDLPDMDILIEDGAHTIESQKNTFENSIHKIKDLYVIEDVLEWNISSLDSWAKNQNIPFRWFRLNHPTNNTDNNLLIFYKNPDFLKNINI